MAIVNGLMSAHKRYTHSPNCVWKGVEQLSQPITTLKRGGGA